MRIALAHNIQLSSAEEEAEFDRPETIARLADAMRSHGHEVVLVEVSGPASLTVAKLEEIAPDIVFNTAEGRHGRFREAFYPALFDELGLPFTGSDAYTCALTLDKRLSKRIVAEHGVPVARDAFVQRAEDARGLELRYPVILKPNYEGSSKGIDADSIVDRPEDLVARADALLRRYPDGVLIEEFIEGRDVSVPFLEGVSRATGGVLSPADYEFPEHARGERAIYDFALKQGDFDAVKVRVPAQLSPALLKQLTRHTQQALKALGVRDLARVDYRVTPTGELVFLEVNALPSLEPGASLYESARLAGLETTGAVLEAVIRSALRRRGLSPRARPRVKPLRVGLIHNVKRAPAAGEDPQAQAEFDSPRTIEIIARAIESHGHEVVALEAAPDLLTRLPGAAIDIAFNIAEGLRGRSREAQVPAVLEMLGIEYTGSDPTALSLTLDKGLAKRVVALAGVDTPQFVVMKTGRERLPTGMRYPVVVKPVAEGSSKGIDRASVVSNEASLRARVKERLERYRQPVLVETFLPGREFTVGVLGERRARVLPPMEIVFLDTSAEFPLYTYDDKFNDEIQVRYEVPAAISPKLQRALESAARRSFKALGCRDVARIDFRLDAEERVHFLECNPLPGLTPEFSDLCKIAEGAGMTYNALIGEILASAIRRRKLARRTARSLSKA